MGTIGNALRSTPTPQVAGESASRTGPTRAEKRFFQLAALVDSIDDAIIAEDLDGTIEAWNAAAEKLYGYTREEAVGHPIAMLVPPEVLDEFAQVMERVRRGEWIGSLETVRQRKDGTRVQVTLTISPIRDAAGGIIGSSAVARDLSERRRMETQVLKSRARMRAILDTAVDAILSIDGRGLIQSINPATERMFGYTSAELVGQNVKILMPPPYHQEHDGYLERCNQTGEKRIIGIGREVQARRKDGTVFAIDLAVSEVEPGMLFTGIIRDISERKLAEKALLESYRLAAIGSMARGIGHDIRNLLQSFHLAVCLLDRCCQLSPDGVEALQLLRSTTVYLRDLARGLHLAAMDSQAPGRGAAQTTQLMDWWPATAALLKAVSHPGIALEPSIASGLPSVRISPHQLTQVVFNLVCNAYNALKESTPVGGGVVRVMAMLKPDGHGVRVQVADNGTGMSPEVLARAFEPLFTTRAARGGTGLGLALVKSVVAEAGGEVSIQSTLGIGTTVTVDLCAAPTLAELSEDAAGGPTAVFSIADTHAAVFLRRVLESLGTRVRTDNDSNRADIWIVDPAATDVNEVKHWRADRPRRRLVLFGRPDRASAPTWEALQPLTIENPDDFEGLRATIERSVAGG